MKSVPAFLMALASLSLGSCKRSESGVAVEPPPRTFIVQGFLRGINFAEKSVTVEHEEVPDYMPAMTMPFDVKTMAEVEPLHAGDAIEFRMMVTRNSSWIEGVKKIDPREVQLPGKKETAGTENVARLKEGDSMPAFELVDSKGRKITRETFAGKPLLLTFIFTRCPVPNFCPLMTNNFREIQQALAPASNVQLLSVSFDSEFDKPEVLAKYAAHHTSNSDQWRFASGSEAEIKRLTQAFSLSVQPESGTIVHGLATALVGADGVIRHIWRGNGWKSDEVIQALHAL